MARTVKATPVEEEAVVPVEQLEPEGELEVEAEEEVEEVEEEGVEVCGFVLCVRTASRVVFFGLRMQLTLLPRCCYFCCRRCCCYCCCCCCVVSLCVLRRPQATVQREEEGQGTTRAPDRAHATPPLQALQLHRGHCVRSDGQQR